MPAESGEGPDGHLDKAVSAHTAHPLTGGSEHTPDSGSGQTRHCYCCPAGHTGGGASCVKVPGPSYPRPCGVPAREAQGIGWASLACPRPAPFPQEAQPPPLPSALPGCPSSHLPRPGGQGGSPAQGSPSGTWGRGGRSSCSSSSGCRRAAAAATRCLGAGRVSREGPRRGHVRARRLGGGGGSQGHTHRGR